MGEEGGGWRLNDLGNSCIVSIVKMNLLDSLLCIESNR